VDMSLEGILESKKDVVLKRWFQHIIDTYPEQTSQFLKREKNPFANPVGAAVYEGIEGVYGELARDLDRERVTPALDRIIRIRAVQDFPPSGAVGFVFPLKRLLREALEEDLRKDRVTEGDLASLDRRIEELALLAFDVYTECREKIFEIRVNEVKARSHRLLQRANLIVEDPD